jgi:hypothetical protein
MNPYLEKISNLLAAAHISAEVVRDDYWPDTFGDSVVEFRVDSLLLRFSRDRSHEFLEIACALAPERYIWFGDIEVAMGWRSLERVLAGTDSQPIEEVVNRVRQHLGDLKKIFFKNLETFERTAITRTMRKGHLHIISPKH